MQGVTFGFFIAIILFAINYSKRSVIKIEINAGDHASNVDRDPETRELLNNQGNRVLVLILQGFIFLGTANKLVSAIRSRIMDKEGSCFDYLVLDLDHVSQFDTSAIVTFSRLAQLSERVGFHVIISSADDNSIKQLVKHRFFVFADLTWERHYKEQLYVAVDWCERRISNDFKLNAEDHNLSLPDIIRRIAYDESDVFLLAKFFKIENKKAGEYLFQEEAMVRASTLSVRGR